MSNPRVVAIIQARMKSTRLPNKVLAPIQGEPMLIWVVERAMLAKTVDEVVVATTTDNSDDAIVNQCKAREIAVYRGDPEDVLDRFWNTAMTFNADVIVRLTADCPLMDPELIDETVKAIIDVGNPVDFAATRLPWERTYPIGLDVEVCTRGALSIAWEEAVEAHQREHVMPYLYENPERFRIQLLNAEEDFGDLRWTVDTKEDMAFIRSIAARLPDRSSFRWRDILTIVNEEPELKAINADVEHKTHRDVG
jgi:spore coat polysaccharide biosynthesis protein SpsF